LLDGQRPVNMPVRSQGVNAAAPGPRTPETGIESLRAAVQAPNEDEASADMSTFDLTIIGGGIVGLATAREWLRRRPDDRLVLLEKDDALARHQSTRNSGVLHAGVYYAPGSLKAQNCRAGKAAMEAFCEAEDIPFERCGKVVVATHEAELPALRRLGERAMANGVACEPIDAERLAEIEPNAAGIAALHVPETGITDFALVCDRLARRVREAGGELRPGTRVTGLRPTADGLVVETTGGDVETRRAVNCAGLYSDRVAAFSGLHLDTKIIPFRGEYYELKPEARSLVRALIYPVPDPRFPFLGVHFTRMIGGGVECGPNAVLAFAREGYRMWDIDPGELLESVTWPGFLRLVPRYGRLGLGEMWRSVSKKAFVRALQRLVPDIRAEHLQPAPAGVRAQAVRRDGSMVDDFLFVESERVLHVLNAPSPAATAALNIAIHISDRLEAQGR
jgi:L-2-hydroxyglutarate oxidase